MAVSRLVTSIAGLLSSCASVVLSLNSLVMRSRNLNRFLPVAVLLYATPTAELHVGLGCLRKYGFNSL